MKDIERLPGLITSIYSPPPFEPNMDSLAEDTIPGAGWLDPAAQPWCAELEAQTDAILAELQRLLDLTVWIPWGTAHYTPTFTRMSEAELLQAAAGNPEAHRLR